MAYISLTPTVTSHYFALFSNDPAQPTERILWNNTLNGSYSTSVTVLVYVDGTYRMSFGPWTGSASGAGNLFYNTPTVLSPGNHYFQMCYKDVDNTVGAMTGMYNFTVPMSAPTSFTATEHVLEDGVAYTRVDCTWTAVPGATEYRVYNGTTKLATIADGGASSAQIIVPPAPTPPTVTYNLTIRAYASGSESTDSNSQSVTMYYLHPIYETSGWNCTSTNVVALASSRELDMVISLYTPEGVFIASNTSRNTESASKNYALITDPTNYQPNTPHSYYLTRSIDGYSSAPSQIFTLYTKCVEVVANTSNITATSATISWTGSATYSSIKLYNGASEIYSSGAAYGGSTSPTLSPNTYYGNLHLEALNGAGVNTTTAITPFWTKATTPTGLSATSLANSISFSWSGNGTSYNVSLDGGAATNTSNPTHTATGLTANSSHSISVTALNGEGTATTAASLAYKTKCNAPVNVVYAQSGIRTATITWASPDQGADSYAVVIDGVHYPATITQI